MLLVKSLGLKLPNAYLVSKKERKAHGRQYTKMEIISKNANRFVVRRYRDDGGSYMEEIRTHHFIYSN